MPTQSSKARSKASLQAKRALERGEGNKNALNPQPENTPSKWYGGAGDKVALLANYFELKTSAPDLTVYFYTLEIAPGGNKTNFKGKHREQILRLMLDHPTLRASKVGSIATDLKATLVTGTPLHAKNQKVEDLKVGYRAEGAHHAPEIETTYTVKITLAHEFTIAHIMQYLDATATAPHFNMTTALQALNVILGDYARQSYKVDTVGTKRIFPHEQKYGRDLGFGLIALRGFFFNAVGATSKILVNVNISHGAFYCAIPLLQLIRKHFPAGNAINYHSLQRFLKKLRMTTTHLLEEHGASGKVRTIFGLATIDDGAELGNRPQVQKFGAGPLGVKFFRESGTSTSSQADPSLGRSKQAKKATDARTESKETVGEHVTVQQFFRDAYHREIDDNIPLVNVGTKSKPVYLPPEVCVVSPCQISRLLLDSQQTSNMIAFAKKEPKKSRDSIAGEGLGMLGFLPAEDTMKHFGLRVSDKLTAVTGRVLEAPQIAYKIAARSPKIVRGGWNFSGNQFLSPKDLRKWYCLRIADGEDHNLPPNNVPLGTHLWKFASSLKGCGIKADEPVRTESIHIDDFNVDSKIPDLASFFSTIEAQHTPLGSKTSQNGVELPPPLVLVILPKHVSKLYHAIKTLGDRKYGLHTVCVIGSDFHDRTQSSKKFYGPNSAQYFANIALKINIKMRGTNHVLKGSKSLDVIDEGSTMIVGIDVTHPSPGSGDNAPSVFAIVASIDKDLAQWPVELGVQKRSKEEVISDRAKLSTMFRKRIRSWSEQNRGNRPENIIIYRDGVSDSQYQRVLDQELEVCREACKDLYPANTAERLPHFTFIVCTKRHHTRFYPGNESASDGTTGNAKCGTVVDQDITQRGRFNFFLQSHHASLGTARSAHYVVLHDDIFAKRGNPADAIQKMTYNMCWLFGRATKAVSICPPVYLADLACTRARSYLFHQYAPPRPRPRFQRKGEDESAEQYKERLDKEQKEGEAEEKRELLTQGEMITVHERLRDTMFYI